MCTMLVSTVVCMNAHSVTDQLSKCLSMFILLFFCIFWCCVHADEHNVFFLLLDNSRGHGPTGRAL